jgi:hypothetical protein
VLSASGTAKEVIETANLVLSTILSIRCHLLLTVVSLRARVEISYLRAFKSSFAGELPLALTYSRGE